MSKKDNEGSVFEKSIAHMSKRVITCSRCGQPFDSDTHRKCAMEVAEEKRQAHFQKLDAMTFEERLRRIEEILYDKPWKKIYF